MLQKMLSLVVMAMVPLAACSSPEQSNSKAAYGEVEALLATCSSAQSTVVQALQSTDMAVAAASLAAARKGCAAAAAGLRTTPLPGMDSASAADGIEEMVEGLGRIEGALGLVDTAPEQAKGQARAGMVVYQRGVATLTAATR